jgi:hypothetical protein
MSMSMTALAAPTPARNPPQLDTLWAHFAATPARYQDISPSHR